MRTTIVVEDRLGQAARSRARREGISFSALVTRALRSHLASAPTPAASRPFELITVDGAGVLPGIDLDRASELLVAEDEEAYGSRRRER